MSLASWKWADLQDALSRGLRLSLTTVNATGDILHASHPFHICRALKDTGMDHVCRGFYATLGGGPAGPETPRTAVCPLGLVHHVYAAPGGDLWLAACGGILEGEPALEDLCARLERLLASTSPTPAWSVPPGTTTVEFAHRMARIRQLIACMPGPEDSCIAAMREVTELALSQIGLGEFGFEALVDLELALLSAVLDADGSWCIVRGPAGETYCATKGALAGLCGRLAVFGWNRLAWEAGAPAADEQLAGARLIDLPVSRCTVPLVSRGGLRGWLGVTGAGVGDGAVEKALEIVRDRLPPALEFIDLCHRIRSRWGIVLDHLPFGILVLDRAGYIRVANREAVHLLGRPSTALFGREITEVLRIALPEPVMLPAGEGSIAAFSRDHKVSLNGREIALRLYHLGLPGDDHSRDGSIVFLVECSELAALHERILGQERAAAAGQLAAGIAHEIRNPLTAAAGFLQLIIESPNSPKVGEYASWAAHELEHVRRITSDFLSLARPRPPEHRPVNPAEILNDLQRILESEAMLHDIALQMEAEGDLPTVWLDPDQIRQVILNLFNNAVQAMGNGGRLLIGVRAEGDVLVVKVADTGPGIPPEILPKIFQPFMTTKETGTGLGLTVCRMIVEAHGGRIAVESSQGVGTTFRVFLPVGSEPLQGMNKVDG